ncbi:MAG: hypothetical protein CVV23_13055 [Ignavibacteriae bacterium HGW-Ignavibacteriae-2]|jgi:plasmid maintenance system killer protein|nr:MAG: hypothetical protein CVV23_13055 [Ignavibacteriae bacterium HGW-Ignavibacteriae-2]
MAVSMTKTISDLQVKLKKTGYPGKGKKSYWDVLADQAGRQGKWDEDILSNLKEEILSFLSALTDKKLKDLWDQSDASIDSYDKDDVDADKIKDELSEELTNKLLDMLDESSEDDDYFAPAKKQKKKFDDDEDDDFSFSEDDFDKYSEDSSFKDDFDDDRF